MLFGFETKDERVAGAALLVYAVYKSRDTKRGPSGFEMWSQIERFARASSKRAVDIGTFLNKFKPKMACGTINPKWTKTGIIKQSALFMEDGSIITKGNADTDRDFMVEIIEADSKTQKEIIDMMYSQTQRIILLVRDRLEREKPLEMLMEEK